eukprot:CAMPEP_0171890030 /NCGR_PEP_ID=MMETSP0992-20121227/43952_1 /TAXON_ID=483369 /ORGANISM="non described non described, Strain CCMP2098" /LENGTH=899 /DNA_ID=CAMNT_0012517199 /DNA_START=93 /DNA_END=2792 /DNA_ORIENTATION=+
MSRQSLNSSALTLTNLDNFVLPSLALLGGIMPRTIEFHKTALENRALFANLVKKSERAKEATGLGGEGRNSDGAGGKLKQAVPTDKFMGVVMPEDTNIAKNEAIVCGRGIESGYWQFISLSFTVMALFLDQVRDAYMARTADGVVNTLLFSALLFFVAEILLMSFGQKKYFLSFFFWLDIAGTISLILDIPFLFEFLGLEQISRDIGLVSGAKAARGARAARATKLARLVRLIRLVRFVRLLKYVAHLGNNTKSNSFEDDSDAINAQASRPSTIGDVLAEQMSQRVVILVLLVLLVAPLLNAERNITFPMEMTLTAMEYMEHGNLDAFVADHYGSGMHGGVNSNFNGLLYLSVRGRVLVEEKPTKLKKIRTYATDNEIYTANSIDQAGCDVDKDDKCTLAMFDDRHYHKEEGEFGIYLILFMVFLLSFGSWLFVALSRRLVVAPIERMFKVVDIVSISLNSLKDADQEKDKSANQALLDNGDGSDDDDDAELFETSFLEEAVKKMAELLNMGYGAAGAEIIQRNLGLSEGATVETFIAGRKMDAVFAFCDIRKFTNTTEILQENVLRFVNLIGHVVHSNTIHFKGSPNKNIGDAFLLVWKVNSRSGKALNVSLPDTSTDLFPGFSSTKDTAEASTLADGALKAMVQTAYDLHHVNTAPMWELKRELVALNVLPPDEDQGDEEHELSASDDRMLDALIESLVAAGRNVNMGYGLHFGWAIEGAIGSSMKIDASYLSPHVNTAARLEAATKQFGEMILMSGEFVAKLSVSNKQLCRRIDSVYLVGKASATHLYTWDFWTGDDMVWTHPLSLLHKLSSSTNMELGVRDESGELVSAYQYCAKFEDGERAYEEGDWTRATARLYECQKILKEDQPARVLISVMSRFNFNAPPDWKGSRTLTEK